MIRLEGHGYRLAIAPEMGASITLLDWLDQGQQGPEEWRPILEPVTDVSAGFKAGAFVMAPFANRIEGGRFSFRGQRHTLALNQPSEGMAIHGLARDLAFQTISYRPDHAHLSLRVDQPGLAWQFDLDLQVTITPKGVCIALDLCNRGALAMPFGIGLHPWFRKPKGSLLTFRQPLTHKRDARGLPLAATQPQPAFSPDDPKSLSDMAWFDGICADWSPCEAQLSWPVEGLAINLSASGALRHLHVYVPDDRPVVCAEPVSHLPDALNRSELAQMDILEPAEHLSGAVLICAQRLTSCSAKTATIQQEVTP